MNLNVAQVIQITTLSMYDVHFLHSSPSLVYVGLTLKKFSQHPLQILRCVS